MRAALVAPCLRCKCCSGCCCASCCRCAMLLHQLLKAKQARHADLGRHGQLVTTAQQSAKDHGIIWSCRVCMDKVMWSLLTVVLAAAAAVLILQWHPSGKHDLIVLSRA